MVTRGKEEREFHIKGPIVATEIV